jgi:hypothetical protein
MTSSRPPDGHFRPFFLPSVRVTLTFTRHLGNRSMITALSFQATTQKIKLPQMSEGIGNGISVNVWVRRTGTGSRQRIIQLGNAAGEYFVLGTGDSPNSLAVGIERGTNRNEMVCEGALPLNRWVKVTATWFSSVSVRLARGVRHHPGATVSR